jgi:murein DD-endopeptidase MepM/ murein hydrolase activator NlpD
MLGVAALFAVERQSAQAQEEPAEGDAAVSDTPPHATDPAPATSESTPPAVEPVAAPALPVTPQTYVVATGDTIYSIARRYGVSVDAILWANNLTDANVVKVGQKLVIPPSTGKLHVVKDGDTLDALAQSYGVSKVGIATVNGLDDRSTLASGQRLLIPVPVKPPVLDPAFVPAPLTAASTTGPVPVATGPATGSPVPPLISTIAPLVQAPGIMTSSSASTTTVTGGPSVTVNSVRAPKLGWPFSMTAPKTGISQGFRPGHTGCDLYTPAGTTIGACAAGTVRLAEKDPPGFTGYGWIVVIDHGNGVSTWYAHLGSFAVKQDDKVEAGQRIGTVGMTGRTTGPHLHLELRLNNNQTPVDPRLALPPLPSP